MESDELIEFICHPDDRGEIPEPKAASDELPGWYEALDMRIDGEHFSERTVRMCPAFLDALSLGWILPLEADVKVNTASGRGIHTSCDRNIVEEYTLSDGSLPPNSVGTLEITSSWAPNVPDGYSLLVLDPLNRRDQRFEVVPQIIDADKQLSRISAPIIWYADNARTILREETPLFQIVPYKRDSRLEKAIIHPLTDEDEKSIERTEQKTKVNNSWYRTNDWEPKGTRLIEINE